MGQGWNLLACLPSRRRVELGGLKEAPGLTLVSLAVSGVHPIHSHLFHFWSVQTNATIGSPETYCIILVQNCVPLFSGLY